MTRLIIDALKNRYPKGSNAVLEQVANSTGLTACRWADVMVMSLWPSRGMEITGFEIKLSRADWLRELDKPEKADIIFQYCDYWYLLTGSPDIADKKEIPDPWGLMIHDADSGKLKIAKQAPKLKPQPLDRGFVGAVLRRAQEQIVTDAQLQGEFLRGLDEGKRQQNIDNDHRIKANEEEVARLKKRIRQFREKSGLDIDSWSDTHAGEIGEAVRLVLRGEDRQIAQRLEQLRDHAEAIIKDIDRELGNQPSPGGAR